MKIVGEFHPYTGHLRATFGECLHFLAIWTIAIIEGIVQSQLSWQLAPDFLAFDCHASSFPSIKNFENSIFSAPLACDMVASHPSIFLMEWKHQGLIDFFLHSLH